LHETAAAAKALLPKDGHVPLQSWVERRMPNELILRCDAQGHVILAPMKSVPRAKAVTVAEPEEPADYVSDDPFFRTLPADSFLEEEERLRHRILFLVGSAPETARSKGHVDFNVLLKDAEVARYKKTFLPPHVPLESWIDTRIGQELKVFPDKYKPGRLTCRLALPTIEEREQILEDYFDSLTEDFAPEERTLRSALLRYIGSTYKPILSYALSVDAGLKSAKAAMEFPKGVNIKSWIERRMGQELILEKQEDGQFFMSLTEAAAAEAAELQTMGGKSGKSKGKSVDNGWGGKGKVWDEPAVKGKSKGKVLDEPTVKGKSKGKVLDEPATKGKVGEVIGKEEAEAARMEWLSALPEDRLTPEEEGLYDALLGFLSRWTGSIPPTLSNAGANSDVHAARKALFGEARVSLLFWIDNRVGGEIDVHQKESTGEVFFGKRGTLDSMGLQDALSRVSKRKSEATENVLRRVIPRR